MPPVHIKVGGAWKEVDAVHIKTGGAWKALAQIHIKTGGAWKESLGGGPVVSMSTLNVTNATFGSDCFAGVQFHALGNEFGSTAAGVFSVARDGAWLDEGEANEVWISRTLVTGSLNWLDPGAARLILNSTRSFGVKNTAGGTTEADVTFKMWDAASGGNLLQEVTIFLQAVRF